MLVMDGSGLVLVTILLPDLLPYWVLWDGALITEGPDLLALRPPSAPNSLPWLHPNHKTR